MTQTVIENPILNSPFEEPKRHFRFTDTGITNEIVESRRVSSYFIPIPASKKSTAEQEQLTFETEWTQDRVEENKFINQIRSRVARWRQLGRPGITRTTAQLLEHWLDPGRDRRLFFCQIEALETSIYLLEAAGKQGDLWIENDLRKFNEDANPGLFRIALKMATGSGKTVVMAMLIAWHTLNKLANKQDKRFSDAFLIVCPGITIRDRLRVLLPNDHSNYYRQLDLVPIDQRERLGQAKIVITNYHSLQLRERLEATKLTKNILQTQSGDSPFTETGPQMVARVCRELGNKRNIVVLNDEAHHCYRRKPDTPEDAALKGEDKKDADTRNEEAKRWLTGLEHIQNKIGIRVVYDLSATPFFLRGSGYTEGNLFSWVVSDFSLIDAIESGIVKIPRVPVADDSMTGEQPTYRDLWIRIKDDLPKGKRTDSASGVEPNLPAPLEAALQSLYANYEKAYQLWQAQATPLDPTPPPVFIVVCNNTNVSKLICNWISGWEKTLPDGTTLWIPGKLPIFSNVKDGRRLHRRNTFLFDSKQIDSGEDMSDEFKKIAAAEIEQFKAEYNARFPGRDAESITDQQLLREVLNTIGKVDKLGGNIKCVVSVSMLTEGWDANTVTHILGVRAFSTQLLCEQVVGRGLRRVNYQPDSRGFFEPEYAEVYGVPFSFIPCSGSTAPTTPKKMTRVRALEERRACEISFPRVVGYRYDFPAETLTPKFTDESTHILNTKEFATKTEVTTIIGQSETHTLEGLRTRRIQEVEFLLAKLTLELHLRDDQGNPRPWLFPSLLRITKTWLASHLRCQDNTFPQLLLVEGKARQVAEKIARAVVAGVEGTKTLKPILRPYDNIGTTQFVDFNTAKPVYETDPKKCHVSHVAADTDSWEQKMASSLEELDGVVLAYVKNQGLGFTIPYVFEGKDRQYFPDFVVKVKDGAEELNLIVEVSGQPSEEKTAKIYTAENLWVPAVNNHGGFGRWAYINCTDPWDAKHLIQGYLAERNVEVKHG